MMLYDETALSNMHPELAARFSQQQLWDYVAYLKRTGFETSLSPAELEHQSPPKDYKLKLDQVL